MVTDRLKKELEQVGVIQELLDGGLTLGSIAKQLGIKHRQKIHKIVKKHNLEYYKAFDEEIDIVTETDVELWLSALEKVDEIKRDVVISGEYRLPEVLDKEWLATHHFIKENYGGIYALFEGDEGLYLDHILYKCKKCDYKPLTSFSSKKGGYFGVESECKECRNHRLRGWVKSNYLETRTKLYEWRKDNPDLVKLSNQRRIAAEKNLAADAVHLELVTNFGGKCYLTGEVSVHIEHFVPVSWGHGGTTSGNIYYMDGALNISKNNRNPFEWFDYAEKEFGLDRTKFNELAAKLAELNGLTTEQFRSFVYWCDANRRTPEEAAADRRPSVEIWKEAIGWTE